MKIRLMSWVNPISSRSFLHIPSKRSTAPNRAKSGHKVESTTGSRLQLSKSGNARKSTS